MSETNTRTIINEYNRAKYKLRSQNGTNKQIIPDNLKKRPGRKVKNFDSNFIEFIKIETIKFNTTNDNTDDITPDNDIIENS